MGSSPGAQAKARPALRILNFASAAIEENGCRTLADAMPRVPGPQVQLLPGYADHLHHLSSSSSSSLCIGLFDRDVSVYHIP
jgi:hypothetical protein